MKNDRNGEVQDETGQQEAVNGTQDKTGEREANGMQDKTGEREAVNGMQDKAGEREAVNGTQEQAQAEPPQKPAENGKKQHSALLEYAKIVVFACIAALVLDHFIIINAVIPSESMESLLRKDDRIFGFRLAYVFNGPQRYDVVMFKYPVDEETIYIKRVIGLPGETVEIKKGKIYIDGAKTPIEENYLPEEWVESNDGYVFEVPDDCYLMLGDNRNISEDARHWAQCAFDEDVASNMEEAQKYTYVHADKIIGRAVMKYYPKVNIFLNI